MTIAKQDPASMITECPRCRARYRIDPAKLTAEGARLRCVRCEAAFRVTRPAAPRAASEPAMRAPAADAAPPARAERKDTRPLVVVADPDPDSAKRSAAALGGLGFQALVVHDGVEAILAIQRHAPLAALLCAALPKMSGFQLCELMKRNPSLREIYVVLAGPQQPSARERRPPGERYEADAQVESGALPGALAPLLARFAAAAGSAPAAPHPESRPAAQESSARGPRVAAKPAPAGAAEPSRAARAAAAPAAAAIDPNLAKAERLARIVVSDIVLYNPEKFAAAVAAGEVVAAMSEELAEGRTLFEQRVALELRQGRDFLAEELLRVARSRGMR